MHLPIPMSFVVVGTTLDLPTAHGQQRLSAIQCLDLRFFIDAEHQGPVWWVEVKANDITNLVDEQRISRELEGLAAMRLQRECLPNAVHAGDRQTGACQESCVEGHTLAR